MKYWKPRYGPDGQDQERRKTPIYVVLSNEARQRSIEISPLRAEIHLPVELDATSTPPLRSDSSSTSLESYSSGDDIGLESSQTSQGPDWPDGPRAFISLALEEDQRLQTDEWLQWLRSVPALVQHAHVEGVFKSDSSLLLLSLSIAVWDLLPQDPAITLIGFVQNSNMLISSPCFRKPTISPHVGTHELKQQLTACTSAIEEATSALEAITNGPKEVNTAIMIDLSRDCLNLIFESKWRIFPDDGRDQTSDRINEVHSAFK